MKKILVINNIPTPYRRFLFDEMNLIAPEFNLKLKVCYQFEREKGRHWDLDSSKFKHEYFFSKRTLFGNEKYYDFKTLNLDLIKIDFREYEYVIFSPLMSINNALLSLIIPRKKQIHWVESNFESTKSVAGIRGLLKKVLLNRSDRFLVPGEKSINYIKHFNYGCNVYYDFPNIIDFDKYRNARTNLKIIDSKVMRKRHGISDKTKVILVLGEVCLRKGSDLLPSIVDNVGGDYQIIVVGAGDLLENLSQNKALKASNKIAFLGQLTQEETFKYFGLADIFLHLARQDPSPLVCIEAVTAGLVMAVSKSTGNSPEVVNRNGFILDLNSPKSVYKSLSQLISMSDCEIKKLSDESSRLAEQKFNHSLIIRRLFKELI